MHVRVACLIDAVPELRHWPAAQFLSLHVHTSSNNSTNTSKTERAGDVTAGREVGVRVFARNCLVAAHARPHAELLRGRVAYVYGAPGVFDTVNLD